MRRLTRAALSPGSSWRGTFLLRARFRPGGRADVVTTPARLIIVPHEPLAFHEAQDIVGEAVKAMAGVRDALILAYSGLPDPSRSMLDGRTPMLAGPEVKTILARVVHDNIEPALDAVKEASCLTNEDLREDYFIAHTGQLCARPTACFGRFGAARAEMPRPGIHPTPCGVPRRAPASFTSPAPGRSMRVCSGPRRVRVLCIGQHRTSSGPEGSSDKVSGRVPQIHRNPSSTTATNP